MNRRTGRKQAFDTKLGFSEQRQGEFTCGKEKQIRQIHQEPRKMWSLLRTSLATKAKWRTQEGYNSLMWYKAIHAAFKQTKSLPWSVYPSDQPHHSQWISWSSLSTLCFHAWSLLYVRFLCHLKAHTPACEAHSSLGCCSNTTCSTKPSPTSPGRAGLSILCALYGFAHSSVRVLTMFYCHLHSVGIWIH